MWGVWDGVFVYVSVGIYEEGVGGMSFPAENVKTYQLSTYPTTCQIQQKGTCGCNNITILYKSIKIRKKTSEDVI